MHRRTSGRSRGAAMSPEPSAAGAACPDPSCRTVDGPRTGADVLGSAPYWRLTISGTGARQADTAYLETLAVLLERAVRRS